MSKTGKHAQDNDEDGYWPKPVPKQDRKDEGGKGKHDAGKQDDPKRDDEQK
ncbi:MAG: hypothetical protein ACRDSH_10575 [Pseudonocardiaceae bacterium]